MKSFVECILYLVFTGIIFFFIGRFLPKNWFNEDGFPYKSLCFEDGGRIYDKLNIRGWKDRLPDMSKVFPSLMPRKKLCGNLTEQLPILVKESCIAEFTHIALCFTGLWCLKICPNILGVITVLMYILILNLPYILIQRYNRPRFLRLIEKQAGEITGYENSRFGLQESNNK